MAEVSGGDNLLKYLALITEQVTKPGTLRVGFLEGATYPDGKPVAMIAAIQNYGAPSVGIPARPFFSNMVAAKSPGWGPDVEKALKLSNFDATVALNLVGINIEGQLRQSIKDTNSPPLAASTLRKRGVDPTTVYNPKDPKTFGAKPLIDTSHMWNSVAHEVKS